ncbi:MAG: F0F1 ATP synthase subunit B [Lentisphaerae bacterium]|nr:F0F1 ATP synthase subunit B [Lentisphaerota bacterium]
MDQLTLDAGLVFWAVVTFLCLFGLLARFVFRPFRALVERREASIRESLERAEKAREEASRLLARNDEQLSVAREEARKIIGEGHRIAAAMKSEARESARRDAETMAAQARAEIDRELRRGLDELKTTVANLSVRIARQVIRARLDEEEHAKLADEFIERLKKTHVQRR